MSRTWKKLEIADEFENKIAILACCLFYKYIAVSYTHLDVYKRQGVISDLIGVLYLYCFHCTYDDQVDLRNNINQNLMKISIKNIIYVITYIWNVISGTILWSLGESHRCLASGHYRW